MKEGIQRWPNMFCGEEYPLNYVFTKQPDGEDSEVGHCDVDVMGGAEKIKTIRYTLLWSQGTVISKVINRENGNGKHE